MILGDKEYKYTRAINYQGKVIAFASQKNSLNKYEIGYSTLALNSDNPDDSSSWRDFEILKQPKALRPVGYNTITLDFKDGVPSIDAPFDVVTDGLYIYLFRQSTANTLLMDRYVFDEVTGSLQNAWEVRYRRSKKPDIPAGRKDTFGSQDMEGKYFIEPTIELTMIDDLSDGWFKVLILPTELKNQSRWQIFAYSTANSKIINNSIRRSENGLFDLTKTTAEPNGYLSSTISIGTTSASIQSPPTATIYNRQERIKDEYGRYHMLKKETRVMMAVATSSQKQVTVLDYGLGKNGILAQSNFNVAIPSIASVGNALSFTRAQKKYVSIPALATQPTTKVTIEAWLRPSEFSNGTDVIFQSSSSASLPVCLFLNNGKASFYIKNGGSEHTVQGPTLDTNFWVHLAAVWNGTKAIIYVNGIPFEDAGTKPSSLEPSAGYYMGGDSQGFTGHLTEVRLWSKDFSQSDIIGQMGTRINNHNPNWAKLLGYWQTTEPSGNDRLTTVPNSASSGGSANGTLHGPMWVNVNAPIDSCMRPLHFDNNGLSTSAVTLTFANTVERPDILSGNDGKLHLYFANSSGGAYQVAQMDTSVGRAHYHTSWQATDPTTASNSQSGSLKFIAKQTGTTMNYTAVNAPFIAVAAATSGKAEECNVTFKNDYASVEVWSNVPRDVSQFLAVINGNAIQKTSDPVAAAHKLTMYDYTNNISVTPGTGQPILTPQQNTGSYIFSVLTVDQPDNGVTPLVQNTNATTNFPSLYKVGVDPWWVAEPARATISLSRPNMIEVLSSSQMANYQGDMNLRDSLSIEGWINLDQNTTERRSSLLLFNNKSEELSYVIGLDPSGKIYAGKEQNACIAKTDIVALNQWTHIAATYKTNYGLQLSGTRYLDCQNNESLNSGKAVSVETWVNMSQLGRKQTLLSKWDDTYGQSWMLYLDTDNKPRFTVNQVDKLGSKSVTVKSISALNQNQWHHVSAVYDVDYKKETAVEFLWDQKTYAKVPQLDKPLTGPLTLNMWLLLKEPPEVWDSQQKKYVPQVLDTQVLMFTADADAEVSFSLYLDENTPAFDVVTATHNVKIKAIESIRYDDWVHLAVTYDGNSTAQLILNGQVMDLDVETATTNANPTSSSGADSGNNAKTVYTIGGSASQNPFNGYMNEVCLWSRGQPLDQVRHYIRRPISGSEPGLVGYWPMQDRYGETIMDLGGTSNGTLVGAKFIRIEKGQFCHKVLIDGQEVGFNKVTEEIIISEDTSLFIGMDNTSNFLQATVDDVRLWKSGRMNWELEYYSKEDLPANEQGLVSDWQFNTGKGKVAFDDKSENNGIITDASTELTEEDADAMWLTTWFKSNWKVYLNGKKISTQAYTLPIGYGNDQCSIGAMLYNNAVATFFSGEVNELRLWKSVRTQEQIKDNLYRNLEGNEDSLIAYWAMNEGSGDIIGDYCGRGSNGSWSGVIDAPWSISTAPLSSEMPQIKNALGGISKPTQVSILYGPSAATYSDLQVDADDNLIGVLKRSNIFIDSQKALNLTTNYQVGDLDVQFVSQVQMRPTLTGYIEGAPPVPSENLTVDSPSNPDKYVGGSSITLSTADNTVQTYSASRNTGFDMSVDAKLGVSAEQKIEAGLIVSNLIFGFIGKFGVHATFEHSLGWLDDASYSTDSTINQKHTLDMAGGWEDNTYNQLDGGKGRLYVPNNMGYALVKSGTADLYAMRNKNTGALVSYSTRQNPDIPDDYNIIMFKIDPTYIKNGTLDGYIGFQPDKDYKFLTPGVRGSYFKPLEAYALKQRIDREREQLKTFYDEFEAGEMGRRENDTHFQDGDIGDAGNDLGKIILGLEGQDNAVTQEQWKKEFAQRNLVNTYVWTADGGLFTEEEQFSAVRENSEGGSYDFLGKAGVYTEISMSIGLDFELDALFGGHIRTQATKSTTEGASFGMETSVVGEGFLNKTSATQPAKPTPGQYPIAYDSNPAPGKVKGYRFMSFYLAPRKGNFDNFKTIIDSNWLNRQGDYVGSYDPDAFALRQALNNNNEVWSVKHRVTYVSRVPESSPAHEGESIPIDSRKPDEDSIVSNAFLIEKIPVSHSDSHPLTTISKEINTLLDQLKTNPLWGSQITEDREEIKEDLSIYLKGYYELD